MRDSALARALPLDRRCGRKHPTPGGEDSIDTIVEGDWIDRLIPTVPNHVFRTAADLDINGLGNLAAAVASHQYSDNLADEPTFAA